MPGRAVEAPDAVTTTESLADHAEPGDPLAGRHAHAGDAAAGAALRAHAVGAEVQQLGVGGDEAQRLVAGDQLDGADDLVAVLEPDHVPVVLVRAPRG